jgi:lipoprotein-anchoring transpeptidase ErfK/SrfK
MKKGIVVALAFAGLATAAAAAWSSRIVDRPAPQQKKQQVRYGWSDKDRTYLSEAQLLQAKAQGQLDRDVRSILNVPRQMKYGDYVWNDRNVPQGPLWIRVDLKSQIISVFRSGHEIGTAVILYGATEKQTPSGTFPILAKIRDHKSITYDNAPMPYTLRLTGDGVSIHGSDVRWGRATHGCIGVPVEFAHKLFDHASKGDQVVIVTEKRPTELAS